MKRPISAMCLATMLVLGRPAFAQETADEAIRKRVGQYEAAYNAGDAEGLAAIYAPDGSHTYVFGNTDHGRVEIANTFRNLLAGPANGSRLAITVHRVRPLSDDAAVEESSFSMTGMLDAAGKPLAPLTGVCLAVYRRIEGQWFVAAIQCMVPVPPPPAQ